MKSFRDQRGRAEIEFGKPTGYLTTGTITKFHPDTLTVDVKLGSTDPNSSIQSGIDSVQAQLPLYFYNFNGGFIGGYPEVGTPVILTQGEGNLYYIISFLARSPVFNTAIDIPGVSELVPGSVHFQISENTKIVLNNDSGINLGNFTDAIILDTSRSIFNSTFDSKLSFSDASRSVEGIIKRENKYNTTFSPSLRTTSNYYNDILTDVALDPTKYPSNSNLGTAIKNPPFTEKREIVYEFAPTYNVLSDLDELALYQTNQNQKTNPTYNFVDRRSLRTDTLSLSLVAPNYLMETIKGTVVDTYGNILDLNRQVIPVGQSETNSLSNLKTRSKEDQLAPNVYQTIRQLERKSIAYHFELNARKNLTTGNNQLSLPAIDNTTNYARARSRFFFDLDKEGQIKLNVPASSETGNIPLHTRYENYSTVFPDHDPLNLTFNPDGFDILSENYSGNNGVINILNENGSPNTPIDRFTNQPIKYGTVYHNILNTCRSFQSNAYVLETIKTTQFTRNQNPFIPKKDIATPKITNFGKNANAGGRSASFNFDGFTELNIGANTVDRHSLWMDLQGAWIANLGRDLNNNISLAMNCDGEILIQSGGETGNKDTRFKTETTVFKSGAVDIRVFHSDQKYVTIFRLDNEGITVSTPGRITYYADMDITLRSMGKIELEAEEVNIQNRRVARDPNANSI